MGKEFSLISDYIALKWLENCDGDNNDIRRLQLELACFYYKIVNRPGGMLADADYFSRFAQHVHIDPLLKYYILYSRNFHKEASPPTGVINKENLPGRRNKKSTTPAPVSFANIIYDEAHTIILDDNSL